MQRASFFARLAVRSLRNTSPNLRQPVFTPVRASLPRNTLHTSASPRAEIRYVRFGQPSGGSKPPFSQGTDPRKWDTRTRVIAGLGAAGVLYVVTHLEQVPETGRWRFMNASRESEKKMGAVAYNELASEFKGRILPSNHPTTQYIERVVTRILNANNLGSLKHDNTTKPVSLEAYMSGDAAWGAGGSDDRAARAGNQTEWNLIVVNDNKTVNAMASYGNVIVFTGILPICKDEEGLAAVLGHEIGHVVARHNSERMSYAQLLFIAAQALDLVLGIDFGLSRLLMTYLLDLPNSRTQELEADRIGLRLAARACFRPDAAPEMFSRMGEMEKRQAGRLNINWLYTHPTSDSRVKALNGYLHEAYDIQAKSDCGNTSEQFNAFQDVFASRFRSGGFSAW